MWGERLFLSCPFGHTRKERNTIANALSATRKSIPTAISFLYLYEGHYDVALCLGIVLVGARGHFFFFSVLQLLFVAGQAGPVTVGKKREMNRKREEIRSGGLL
jgi:hypothetical protein